MARPRKTEQPTINVSLRIDPKTRYAIELLSREQKRTITGVIEWAVMQALQNQSTASSDREARSLLSLTEETWSPDEAERITLLGIQAPHLLDHEESCLWSVIRNSGFFLKAIDVDENGIPKSFVPRMGAIKLAWPLIKDLGVQLANWSSQFSSRVITEKDVREYLGDEAFEEFKSFL